MADDLRNAIEQIQSRLDIVEVISGYIPLKKSGANYKGLCPFHHEKTPSFMASPAKQIYHCFGCSAGGDVINFIMEYEKVEFFEALRILSEKTGVKLPAFGRADYAVSSAAASPLYRINEMAAAYYNAILVGSDKAKQAREYLSKRGISAQTAAKFKLGFAPDLWDSFLKYAQKKGVSQDALLRAGLIIQGKENSFYDRFRNRVMFPIFNVNSKAIGFGARVIDDSMPKYINSPETEIYTKGRNLYGLNIASSEIRKLDEAVIVEGYLDLIIPFQHGITNIVATLGTALTIEQINLIRRYTSNVVVIYDADEAGEAASLRSLDILIGEGLNVKIASLPKGFDPDTFVRGKSAQEFASIISSAKGLFDYKMDILLLRHGADTSEKKAKVISEMLPTIKRVDNEVLRSEYVRRLSEQLSINEQAIIAELGKVKLDYSKPVTLKADFNATQEARQAEKIIAALLMEDAEIARRIKDEFDIDMFKNPRIKKIIHESFALIDDNKHPTPARLIHNISDEEISQFICQLLVEVENIIDREKTLEDCIKWLKADNLRLRKEQLTVLIKEAERSGDESHVMVLVKEFNGLSLPATPNGRQAGRQACLPAGREARKFND
ncbi:MAG: DNA primase [Candidatus Omnitrophota bacterium]